MKTKNILIVTLIAIILCMSMLFVVFAACNTTTNQEPEQEPDIIDNGGLAMEEEVAGNGIMLLSTEIPRELYGEYGIMPLAESAYSITAKVANTAGETLDGLQDVTFSLAWASTKSDEVANYVKLAQTGNQATITLVKAFDTQIILKCTSDLDTSKFATATIDYAKRINGASVNFMGTSTAVTSTSKVINVKFPSNYVVGGSMLTSQDWIANKLNWFEGVTYGTGSLSNSMTWQLTITPSASFASAYNSYKNSSVSNMATTTINVISSASPSIEAVNSVTNLYKTLSGQPDANGYLAGMGGYRAFSMAFYKTTNQFDVTVTVTPRYGDVQTYKYVLNVTVDAPDIANVTFDKSSFVF